MVPEKFWGSGKSLFFNLRGHAKVQLSISMCPKVTKIEALGVEGAFLDSGVSESPLTFHPLLLNHKCLDFVETFIKFSS